MAAYRGARFNSIYAVAATVAIHSLVILLFIKLKPIESRSNTSTLQMIRLRPHEAESVLIVKPPNINFKSRNINVNVPDISFADRVYTELDLIQSPPDIPYELPDPNNAKYRGVFDPKMRQKLLDAQRLNRPRANEKPESWTEADGRTFVDMGNGDCLVSMQKVDSRERGTNWGHTRCGKTDSEKTMDRVMADVESRKSQSRN
ncbi:MAG: hypothetical protein EOO52_10320 [Gammaproteobacteria bacterium]|nr:MAG: hypothetical protein EOO52_10320 [Gammaproteobacteria bacterium]